MRIALLTYRGNMFCGGQGIYAAYLARDGLTGPTSVLEGKYGYFKCFSDAPEPEQLTAGLGERFMIDEITVKPYPCCSDLHAATIKSN